MDNRDRVNTDRKRYFAILVNIIIPLGSASSDIYLPSLPAIADHFGVLNALVQLTVMAYAFAMGLAQIIAGPISDALGRKKLLMTAIMIQLIAVIAIIFSPSIYWIIGFRFIQGLGAALMMVPARAIINDIFEGHELKKQFNYTTMAFAIAPIVAPFFGGYLQEYFGWRASFIFILIYIVLVGLLVWLTYKETLAKRKPFSVHHFWKNYQIILSNRYFLIMVFFVSLAWGYGALFNVVGPFLIQVTLHHSAVTYGHTALFMGLAWFLGNLMNRVLFRYEIKLKTQVAIWFNVVITLVMLILVTSGFFNIPTFIIPAFILILLSGFMFPMYVGECLVIFKDLAASANACLFSFVWIFFSIYVSIAAMLKAHSLMPISIAYVSIGFVTLIFYYGFVARTIRE